VLHREYRLRNFAVFATTAAALLGSIYTTASAPLFRIMTAPTSTQVQLITTGVLVPVIHHASYEHVFRSFQ
jgi:hypothetical protein